MIAADDERVIKEVLKKSRSLEALSAAASAHESYLTFESINLADSFIWFELKKVDNQRARDKFKNNKEYFYASLD